MIIKFETNDVFVNTLKTKPHFKFSIHNGQVNFKSDFAISVPKGYTALNDLNLYAPAPVVVSCSYSYDFSEACNTQYIPTI